MRWVLLHLIEEIGRHAGHADIVRESIDGATMYELMAGAEGWPATDWLQPWTPATVRRVGGDVVTGRDGYPAGVPCWVDTEQPDPVAATEFYGPLFGWAFEERDAARLGRPVLHRHARRPDGRRRRPGRGDGDGPPAWNTYIWVDDADESAALVWKEGGTVLLDPVDAGPAGRMAIVTDPSGAPFRLWQAGTQPGRPGRQRRQQLELEQPRHAGPGRRGGVLRRRVRLGAGHVRPRRERGDDVASARATATTSPSGTRHPRAPGRRRVCPTGFADAIGWVEPVGRGRAGPLGRHVRRRGHRRRRGPGRRARRRRSSSSPFDAPAVRIAVLADPQGAVFTVNHFDPSRLP